MAEHAAGAPAYPMVEAKADHLLYFVINNHPFADSNKRIGSLLFVDFRRLFRGGEPVINDVGLAALAWLAGAGWRIAHGPDITPDQLLAERRDHGEVVPAQRLRDALARLNPPLPADALGPLYLQTAVWRNVDRYQETPTIRHMPVATDRDRPATGARQAHPAKVRLPAG
jgi:hypothetical protein